jgi:excisionase family DNA binding protein
MGTPMNADYSTPTWPVLATVSDVARHLAVSRSTVYQLMESGALPYVKLGRCRRIRWSDVDALIAGHRIATA